MMIIIIILINKKKQGSNSCVRMLQVHTVFIIQLITALSTHAHTHIFIYKHLEELFCMTKAKTNTI